MEKKMKKRQFNKVASKKYEQSIRSKTPAEIFNELGIQFKVCPVYQPQPNNIISKVCKCNRQKHDLKLKEFSDNDDHFVTIKVNANSRYYSDSEYKYVRLALDTPEQKIERILFDIWNISKPELIISIIGDKEYCLLTDRLERIFIEELIGVASKTDAWLVTNGYNNGIVQLVGQAINEIHMTKPNRNLIAIAICKWGSFSNFDCISKKVESSTRLNAIDDYKEDSSEHGPHNLELNHSHYLMLDDGCIWNDDTKDFRTRFTVHISRLHEVDNFPIPVVSIVFKGDVEAIENIYYDLRAHIPVILIGDNGGIADFFKRCLLYTRHVSDEMSEICNTPWDIYEIKRKKTSNDESQIDSSTTRLPVIEVDAKNKILSDMFAPYTEKIEKDLKRTIRFDESKSKKTEKSINELVLKIKYCLQPMCRRNISVFNLTSDNNLTETIFHSVCQSRINYSTRQNDNRLQTIQKESYQQNQTQTESIKQQIEKQAFKKIHQHESNVTSTQLLKLAMDWNCIDAAKELVFKNSLDFIADQKVTFLRAVKLNLPMFIYELLKLGLNLKTIFSTDKRTHDDILIKDFYTDDLVGSDETHLKEFIRDGSEQIRSTETLNNVLFDLIGDDMHKLYFENFEEENTYRVENGFPPPIDFAKLSDSSLSLTHDDYIMRDLFLWAILINRIEIAKVLLSFMKYRICPALIAIIILKKYKKKADYSDLKKQYQENANYFEQYAIRCLDCCDDHHPAEACEIILQSHELYGFVTCMQVAAKADAKEFLSTSCCVQAIKSVWYDKLNPEDLWTNKVRILFNILTYGLLSYFFDVFRMVKHNKKNTQFDHCRHTLNRHGINYPDLYFLKTYDYCKNKEIDRYIRKIFQFHRSPCVKYFYHLFIHLFFLLLFSYVLLFNFSPPKDRTPSIHGTEIATIILVICMFIEEIHYILSLENCTRGGKISNYLRHFFKTLTLIGFLLFLIGLILRFVMHDEDKFIAARIVMAIDLEIWWIHLLSFAACMPIFGPHLFAMGRMLKELFYFLGILGVFICGYGVASRSMYFYQIENNLTTARNGSYDTRFDGRSVFRQVIYPVYYFLHGGYDHERTDLDKNSDVTSSIVTHILLAFHIMFVNILLLNLLIAIFSKRYDSVYDQATQIWHSQRYIFVREYFLRSPLFPPISFIYDIYYISQKIFHGFQFCTRKPIKYKRKQFKMISKEKKVVQTWAEIEGSCTYQYAHNEVKALKKSPTDINLHDHLNQSNYYKQRQDDILRLDESFEHMNEDFNRRIQWSK